MGELKVQEKQDFINELQGAKKLLNGVVKTIEECINEAEQAEELTEDKQLEIVVKLAVQMAKLTK